MHFLDSSDDRRNVDKLEDVVGGRDDDVVDGMDDDNDNDVGVVNIDHASDEEYYYSGNNDDDEVLSVEYDSDLSITDDDAMNIDEEVEGVDGIPHTEPAKCFLKHSNEVYSCDIDRTGTLAVTGGRDDKAFVWDINTLEVLFECTNHTDSVLSVGFNHDGKYVATGDMSGLVQVWSVSEKKLIFSNSLSSVEWLMWHKASNILFAVQNSGEVFMWLLPSGQCKVFVGSGIGSECAALTMDGKKMVIGYANGCVTSFDLKTTTALSSYELESDTTLGPNVVTDLDIHPNDETFVAGFTDGTVFVASLLSVKEYAKFVAKAEIEAAKFITGTDVCLVAVGTRDGLEVWDYPVRAMRYSVNIKFINHLLYNAKCSRLFASCSYGDIHAIQAMTGDILFRLTGPMSHIYYMTLSKDETYLLTVGSPNICSLYDISSTNSAESMNVQLMPIAQ